MHKYFALAALAVLAACNGKNNYDAPKELRVDADRCVAVDVDTTRMVRLEASDSSRLFGIDRLLPIGGAYVVSSRSKLRAFDKATGRYLCDVAKYGTAEQDFSDISNAWSCGDTIMLFDANTKSVGKYLADGTFVGKDHPFRNTQFRKNQPPRMLFKLADGSVITINGSTGGSTQRNPLVSLYGNDYSYRKALPDRQVKESSYLMDGACPDSIRQRMLIWEPLRDTVFAANSTGIRPAYVLNTGKNSLPAYIQNLPHMRERLSAFFSKENGNGTAYVSLIRYLQPDGDNLYFCLTGSDRRNYLVRYDTTSDSCNVRTYASADGRYSQTTFFLLDCDSLRMELRDNANIESNPIIYSIHKHELQ